MFKKDKDVLLLLSLLMLSTSVIAQPRDLDLEEDSDLQLLMDDFDDDVSDFPDGDDKSASSDDDSDLDEFSGDDDENYDLEDEVADKDDDKDDEDLDSMFDEEDEEDLESKSAKTSDDLEQLKDDLSELDEILPEENDEVSVITKKVKRKPIVSPAKKPTIFNDDIISGANSFAFDVGKEEKILLDVAKDMQGKIPDSEWGELADAAPKSSYTVASGDWLWKISQKIFGSGFYYSKIWSLNPYITNPHLIEPGMVLSFNTGTEDQLPDVRVGSFDGTQQILPADSYERWGESSKPGWIDEREKIANEGIKIEYASPETDIDLKEASQFGLIKEYEAYTPPKPDFIIEIPDDEYDESGFDRNAKVSFNFKEGFYLTTFVSTNVVQDLGSVSSAIKGSSMLTKFDSIFINFDENIDIVVGDRFSIYAAHGEAKHENSDRKGYKYSVVGNVKVVQKHDNVWECLIEETTGVIQRGDRVTIYTPKIERITKTFSTRTIESAIIASFSPLQSIISFGDVVYLDRGRADGVEVGNIFEMYGFKDRGTDKNITDNPTYKNGELTVVTLTDNFATAVVSSSTREFKVGDLAVTKSKASAISSTKDYLGNLQNQSEMMMEGDLDKLDVELNIDNLNDALLDKADQIKFTEDELAELERQEKEKSFMTQKERDLRSLERLEGEIEGAEKMLKEARLDEDKLLENRSLEDYEKGLKYKEQEGLDEIEENFGKRYLDEKLNDKENPFGLTEFDIEEIDELLNLDLQDGAEVKNSSQPEDAELMNTPSSSEDDDLLDDIDSLEGDDMGELFNESESL